jgi:glycosyltransferase involved in cell wall biosynthesis
MKVVQVFRALNHSSESVEILFRAINPHFGSVDVVRFRLLTRRADPFSVFLNGIYLYLACFRRLFMRDVVFHITGECYYMAIFLFWKKTLVTFHDDYALIIAKTKLSFFYKKYLFYEFPMRCAKQVVFISCSSKSSVGMYCNVPTEALVIHNPLTLGAGNEIEPESGFNKLAELKYILIIGTNPNKNIVGMFNLLPINANVVVLGELDAKHKEILLQKNVSLFNFVKVSESELRFLYSHAFFLLFLSKCEGFGLPIIEAQYYKCPVVCSKLKVFYEIADSSSVVFFDEEKSDLNEEIIFLSDIKYRSELIKNGSINASRFEPVFAAQSYEKLYCDLISTNA